MFVKPFILLALVGHCLCYSWGTEGNKFNNMCEKVQKAFMTNKLSYTQIESQLDTCLAAHIGKTGAKSYVMKYLTTNSNTNEAYKNTYGSENTIKVDSFHNFVYCMEGLIR
ncbi:uncharacterized protein LOC109601112 [Aethina tumida]|uniref:uncharacterized protein LOC109601112 n=1 Tax=Aethina tumida TaxID=116153 RepID=UPI00096B1BD5|nr:uncharacterized protein LOC109601112 [Aethina tumida]